MRREKCGFILFEGNLELQWHREEETQTMTHNSYENTRQLVESCNTLDLDPNTVVSNLILNSASLF